MAKLDDAEDPLWQESVSAVKAIGPRALEPALSAFASCRDPEGRSRLGDVLAHLSVRDDRVLDALVRNLEDDVSLAAGNLVEYGDPCALPALAAAFDAAPVEEDEPSLASNLDVIELAAAIEALGGVLTPERRAKLERDEAARQDSPPGDRRGMTPVDSVEAVGRRRAAGGNRFRAEGYSMSRYSACSLAAVATSSTKPSSDSQTRSGDDVSRA